MILGRLVDPPDSWKTATSSAFGAIPAVRARRGTAPRLLDRIGLRRRGQRQAPFPFAADDDHMVERVAGRGQLLGEADLVEARVAIGLDEDRARAGQPGEMLHLHGAVLRQRADRDHARLHAAVEGSEIVVGRAELEQRPVAGAQAEVEQRRRNRLGLGVELGIADCLIPVDHGGGLRQLGRRLAQRVGDIAVEPVAPRDVAPRFGDRSVPNAPDRIARPGGIADTP